MVRDEVVRAANTDDADASEDYVREMVGWWLQMRMQGPLRCVVCACMYAIAILMRLVMQLRRGGRCECVVVECECKTYLGDLLNVADRLDALLDLTQRGGLSGGRVEAGTGSNGDGSGRVEGRHGGTGSTRKHRHFGYEAKQGGGDEEEEVEKMVMTRRIGTVD